MDFFEIRWFSQETKKWQTDYASVEKDPIFFSTQGDNKYTYHCPKSLGGDMHSVFESFFSNVFLKEINVANMSICSPQVEDEDYIFGQFEIVFPEAIF